LLNLQSKLPSQPEATMSERLISVMEEVLKEMPPMVSMLAGNYMTSFRQQLTSLPDEAITEFTTQVESMITYIKTGESFK
jgi:hypothetical protein